MTPRSLVDRLLSPAGFGLALLFFLLPFVSVSCGAQVDEPPNQGRHTYDVTFTGVDLLIGGSPDVSLTAPDDAGQETTVRLDDEGVAEFEAALIPGDNSQPLAIAAATVIFFGMTVSLVLPLRRRVAVSFAVAATAAALLVVQVVVVAPGQAADVLASNEALANLDLTYSLSTRPAIGFYSALTVLIATAVGQYLSHRRLRGSLHAGDPGPPESGF
jgi:hypothetical protein